MKASKSVLIRELYAMDMTISDIAEMVGVSREYVRVCARQRANGISKADAKYVAANPTPPEVRNERQRVYKKKRWHADPEFKARLLASHRRYRAKKLAERTPVERKAQRASSAEAIG